jgi:hypothetical protein
MATKLDTEKKLFLGNTPVREATTFGAIRKFVNELNTGEGVSYTDLEAHMLENFKPAKSANYDGAYVKSYVRDAVNKFGYLSHEDLGAEYTVVAPAEKAEAEPVAKKLTKADKARLDVLAFVRDKGEVSDESDLDATKITTETIVSETKKKQKTVDGMIAALAESDFVRTEEVEGATYVFLTPAGLKHVNENAPVVPGDQTPGQQVVEDATDDDA